MGSKTPPSSFTNRLFHATRDRHSRVDRHPFIDQIREQPMQAWKYICLNEYCIASLQTTLTMDNDYAWLQQRLWRPIPETVWPRRDDNVFTDHEWECVRPLVDRCRQFPLEHAYMFYLGLLKGGNMLRKSMSFADDAERLHRVDRLLAFDDASELVSGFKAYLDHHELVIDPDDFIDRVRSSYDSIAQCFDRMMNDYLI